MSEDLPVVSVSQVNLHTKCPEAHRRSYIEKEKIAPGFKAHRGTGAHLAIEANMATRMFANEPLPLDEVKTIARDGVHKSVSDQGVRIEPGEGRGMAALLGEAVDHAIAAAALHYKVVAPKRDPIALEAEFVIEHEDFKLRGVVDEIDFGAVHFEAHLNQHVWSPVVRDTKTRTKTPSEGEVRQSIQLPLYADAVRTAGLALAQVDLSDRIDAKVERVVINERLIAAHDYLVVGMKKKPDTHIPATMIESQVDTAAAYARVRSMLAMTKAGVVHGAPPDAWWCSDKWCGYHSTCPFAMGRKQF